MKRAFVWTVLAVSCLLAAAPATFGQEARPEFLLVYQEHARPAMVQQYEESTKEFLAALTAAKVDSPTFDITVMECTDFSYMYMTPLCSMADLDTMHKEWMGLPEKLGKEKMKAIEMKGSPAMESADEMIAMKEPDLSFVPSEPRLKPSEDKYYVDDYFYITYGKDAEFRALAKQIAEMFKKKGLHNGYTVFSLIMGNEMPLFVVAQPGKDAVDWFTQDAQDWAALGPDGQGLIHQAMALCRKYERRMGTIRPDLSYHPQAKKAG